MQMTLSYQSPGSNFNKKTKLSYRINPHQSIILDQSNKLNFKEARKLKKIFKRYFLWDSNTLWNLINF